VITDWEQVEIALRAVLDEDDALDAALCLKNLGCEVVFADEIVARVAELEAENERLRANQRTGRIIHGDALPEEPDRSEE
jgi:hypothetical protein